MAGKTLRAVAPDEKPARSKPLTVAEAAAEGTPREELVALRSRIAKAIDDPDIRGADLASLSRRLLEIRKDIEAIDAREEQDGASGADEVEDGRFDASAV
jgi:hypothetical protein